MPSSLSSATSVRPGLRRVRASAAAAGELPGGGEPNPASPLAADSLGWSLLLAARVLAGVRGGRSLDQALTAISGESPPARAAAQEIAYGVLRRYGWNEAILGRLMQKPLSHAETEALLLAALYRLESRPEAAHTVVDQAVRASGEIAGGVFKGLVNGVLRNYLRQREALAALVSADDAVRHAHPAWWLARLRRGYPDDWERIVKAGNALPPMSLRVNRRRGTREDYAARLAAAGFAARPAGPQALMLSEPAAVEALPGFREGAASVQDAGAQRAAGLLAPADGWRVLDACAAPGGKAAHLLELADIDLLALDFDPLRARRIEENFARLGLQGRVKVADCREVGSWWDGRPFEAILADVPCSASGVVRRHPDIKHLRRESDIRRFARTQAEILDALWPLLAPGGRFLYATCSLFAEENEGQIDAFLVRRSGAERLLQEYWIPDDEHDGFYYALLRKTA